MIYIKQELYNDFIKIPAGERSKLINKLLKEYFDLKKEEEEE